MTIAEGLSFGLLGAGAFFFMAGSVGLIRLPDRFTRLHALTKADNVGLGLIVLGLMPLAADVREALKLGLIWILVVIAGATGAHLIAKRALRGDGEDAQ
ncbi:monovalent cation/H(+) antiporter subunit G [Thiohalocapsa marina]|uniref:Monovalent cation/H(+) antiporter subunit G n=1 Tax=Thiohalocapsa marina TaxID=424902 RepID=A0A5M8FTB6_9GAMM|nr:monovalent cation/H(+) antiporter subunit G [Thiohalocapsa marina]KAA6187052.1 monovalent cation/H(+) antiporter subunit G [Thiohalocapsa marina]